MRIAVDTGGTFTDVVIIDNGSVSRFKIPSTPHDPALAILAACKQFAGGFELIHGTTVATNAVLEGKTARTGLIVNEGFRDLLRLGRQSRPELYTWEPRKPLLPVRDEDVRTVQTKGPAGSSDSFNFEGCEAVAVCLLYSYSDPQPEREIAEQLSRMFVGLSHEVSAEMREYERACATVLNAAVGPVITRYFGRLQETGAATIKIMASLGGLISVEDATRLPIRTVVSGPAGGVVATLGLGRRLGRENTIALDMGGTSTDVTLIHNYEPAMTACADIAGLPVRLRRIDVHTIGCGGGSIAFLDAAGALCVGPESAGADPGPALFGGSRPTVTDANFILQRLPLSGFAERGKIDEANCRSVMENIAESLGLDLQQSAEAVVAVADAQMAAAVRKISAERGLSPSEFALVAFGGAGGLHACAVADLLEIREILCPVGAGVFSALGLLNAPDAWEESLGVLGTDHEWQSTYADLEAQARSHLTDSRNCLIQRVADLRYQGQSHELSVGAEGTRGEAEEAFHAIHREIFGTNFAGTPVQWVAARVRAESPSSADISFLVERRSGAAKHGVIQREALSQDSGPLVVADSDCSIYIAAGWSAEVLADGTIRLTRD